MDRTLSIIQQAIGPIIEGMVTVTLPLALLSCFVGLILAFVFLLMRYSRFKLIRGIVKFIIWLIRGLPLLVLLYFLFYGLGEFNIFLTPWQTALIAFSLFQGAFMSEALRGALSSVDAGQWEAGLSLGLTRYQTFRLIILRQGFPIAIPTLIGYIISAVKMTSLVSSIGLSDMMLKGKQFIDYYYAPFIIYALISVFYLLIFTVLTVIQRYAEKYFNQGKVDYLAKFLI